MPFIKKLVMHGFKSFVQDTEVPFENSMNVIVGPNGSGKSNITDAICFVLGRMSAKSIRAEKTSNLIFAGTKAYKPASEASVKLVFNNSDKVFPMGPEVEIERIVRRNGQGIYKINKEVKTRQEVLELMAAAGVDPYGFNIVLQGEITSLIKSSSEERRKVIEEVAGISIYESRKIKSLHELEKTEERLKEVSTILRERTAYLKNLENERAQALKFKQLEETAKRCKASILKKQIDNKLHEISKIDEQVNLKTKERDKLKLQMQKLQQDISQAENKINEINQHIQKSTGIEQETLTSEVTSLREQLAALEVKNDSSKRRLEEIFARRQRASDEIKDYETQISDLRKRSPLQAKKTQEIAKKRQEMEDLEKNKRKFYSLKQELQAIKQRIEDKKSQIQKNINDVDFTLKEVDKIQIKHKNIDQAKSALVKLHEQLSEKIKNQSNREKDKLEYEKNLSVGQSEIKNLSEIVAQVKKIDICPLCKTKITEEHIGHVRKECDEKISSLKDKIIKLTNQLSEANEEISSIKGEIKNLENAVSETQIDIVRLENVNQRTESLKRLHNQKLEMEKELNLLEDERDKLVKMQENFKYSEEKYEQTLLEIETISARTEENIDYELQAKEQELERVKLIIKQGLRDEQDLKQEVQDYEREINDKSSKLEIKEEQDRKLKERFQKLFEERTQIQGKIQQLNSELINKQHEIQQSDNAINNTKIDKARFDAETQTLQIDFSGFTGIELISASVEVLREKLQKSEDSLRIIGSVNLRALEVYDTIKKEYDEIAVKVQVLDKEKLEIIKIIDEIDIKKRKSFMKTLSSLNEIFTRNFMQLSTKGEVFLDVENKEDPFAAGLDILVKVGKGKFFDVTSLSGGEQTLVALSLIFAIQEYKPYCFYIFDEVDAALDKRNSERLAALIKKHMKNGQYIVVTHNDAIITESALLYGVTMQEGISKIISMHV